MSDGMASADEARAMLDGVPDIGETVAAGQDTLGNAVTGGGRYGVAVLRASELLGDMERLARTVIALHAIIEGRATPPTDAEIAAHDAAGGTWLVRYRRDGWGGDDAALFLDVLAPRDVRGDGLAAVRWWPLDASGRPCAWPEVPR